MNLYNSKAEQYQLNQQKDLIHIKNNQVLREGQQVKMSYFSLDSNKPDSTMFRLKNTETKGSYQLQEVKKYNYPPFVKPPIHEDIENLKMIQNQE